MALAKVKPLSRRFYASSKCGSEWHLRKLLEYHDALRKQGVKLVKKKAK
jgi:hypothetical protein